MSQRSRAQYPVQPHTFVSPSADSRRAVVSYWRKYVHEVLVNRLGGLSLPRKPVIRFTDCSAMTIDVYRGHETTMQQQQGITSKTYQSSPVRFVTVMVLQSQAQHITSSASCNFSWCNSNELQNYLSLVF